MNSQKVVTAAFAVMVLAGPAAAQSTPPSATPPGPARVPAEAPVTPEDYVIGPNDLLTISFWRDDTMTTDVLVRPDGRITLPLLNDIMAAGLTPEALGARITEAATKFLPDPSVVVIPKQINSRMVFITGMVGKGGPYPLMQPTTVMQLIAMAGGVSEWAKEDRIVILRSEGGKELRFRFNYKQVLEGKNPQQNILLKPGDTVIIP
jgi:polysaccharide export outer membrane protein